MALHHVIKMQLSSIHQWADGVIINVSCQKASGFRINTTVAYLTVKLILGKIEHLLLLTRWIFFFFLGHSFAVEIEIQILN